MSQMPHMKVSERHARILEIIAEKGFTSVKDLCAILEVSEMTIRRDFQQLDREGKMKRHHGGATLEGTGNSPEHPFNLRRRENADLKAIIGARAATLVQPNDVVFLDGGTTTLEVARHFKQPGLTVVNNCLPTLQVLGRMPHIRLFGLGGEFMHDNQCFVGAETLASLEKLSANVLLLATTCLSFERGLTNRDSRESEVKRQMVKHAAKVILLMDSSKMNKQTLSHVCDLSSVHTLVTDSGIAEADRERLEKLGIRVEVVTK